MGVENNYPAVVQAVLKHYASDVCAGDRDGYLKKVMHLVVDKCKDKPAQCNEVKMVEVLLHSEIIPVNELDENDLTLLRKAGLFAPHLLPTLLNHSRVDPNVKDNHGRPALYYVILHSIRRSIELDTKEVCLFLDNPKVEADLSEYLPLTLQSGEKGLRMALCLLEHSASHRFNVDELTFDSALRELIYMHGDQYGKCADFNTCMSKLIEKGADINGEPDCKDEFPILHIIAEGQGRCVTMDAIASGLLNHIIDMGAKLNCTSLQGFTPLHVAASASNYEAINILLGNKDTDLYVKNEYGHSIFDCALGRLELEYNTPTDDSSIDTASAIVKAFLTTERFKLEKKQDIRDVFDAPVPLENKKILLSIS